METDTGFIRRASSGCQGAGAVVLPVPGCGVVARLEQVPVQTFDIDLGKKARKAGDKMFGGPCRSPGIKGWSGT